MVTYVDECIADILLLLWGISSALSNFQGCSGDVATDVLHEELRIVMV